MSPQPLDVLETALDEVVTVRLKDGSAYHGSLVGYDQHLNLVLDEVGPTSEGPPAFERRIERVEGTIVIRGDNVVSIKP